MANFFKYKYKFCVSRNITSAFIILAFQVHSGTVMRHTTLATVLVACS